MRNQYYPLKAEDEETRSKNLAELEHAYLMALLRKTVQELRSIPMLATAERDRTRLLATYRRILEATAKEPILATLPLVEMKVRMALERNPSLDAAPGAVRLLPIPEK